MGIKPNDIVPISVLGPTAISPPSKQATEEFFQVTRTDTVAVLKQVLAADASVLSINIFGSVASNAATTATVTITISNNSGTISTGSYDVKTSGATTANIQMSALPNLEPFPLLGDLKIQAVYAETGTASTLGGPWVFSVRSVR